MIQVKEVNLSGLKPSVTLQINTVKQKRKTTGLKNKDLLIHLINTSNLY